MSESNEELRKLLDQLSEEDLKKVEDYVKSLMMEEELTQEEMEEIEQIKKEMENGEYYTLEEVFKKIDK